MITLMLCILGILFATTLISEAIWNDVALDEGVTIADDNYSRNYIIVFIVLSLVIIIILLVVPTLDPKPEIQNMVQIKEDE